MTIDVPDASTTPAPDRQTEDLFTMGGKTYTIITDVSQAETLQHRLNTIEVGPEMAIVIAAKWLISDSGYRVFMARALNEPSATMDHILDTLLTAVTYKITGVVPPKSAGDGITGRDPRLADGE
jgi:hypothetical protein